MSEEQDRISALPDAILQHILSFLPTKLSIQTSILSKRWIHLWKFIPVIDIPITSPHKEITESECAFIENTLTHHQALKLHKFSIEFIKTYSDPGPDVVYCIEFAISRQVQILSVAANLGLAMPEEHYALPSMFYSHENVRSLEQVLLKGFLFNPNQPSFFTFASLKTLCIIDCTMDDATLRELMSNSPVLESLTIEWCHKLLGFKTSWCQSTRLKHLAVRSINYGFSLNLEVNVSSLSSFKFCGDLMKISFSAFPSLVEATIFKLDYRQYQKEFEYIRIWFGNLAHVEQLGVNFWFPQFLAREHKVNNNGWTIFQNLKVLSWFGALSEEFDLIALIAFLGHCPSLEKIEIDFRSWYWEAADERNQAYAFEQQFIKLKDGDQGQQLTVEFLHNLKIIMVHHFFGFKSEIEFVKRLLEKAVALETLSLTYRRLEFAPIIRDLQVCRPKELVQEEILSLPRASSHVHILFH